MLYPVIAFCPCDAQLLGTKQNSLAMKALSVSGCGGLLARDLGNFVQ